VTLWATAAMKLTTLAAALALPNLPVTAGHGNMLYPPAWWDANGTGARDRREREFVNHVNFPVCVT
jgi:hypothetical protein